MPLHLEIAWWRGYLVTIARGVPETVTRNLEKASAALEPRAIEVIARDHCRFAETSYLWRLLPNLPGFRSSKRWPINGLGHLEDAVERGKGVILLTAHLGFPHFIPRVLELRGYKVRQVVAELDRLEKRNKTEAWRGQTRSCKAYLYRKSQLYTEILGPDDLVASLDVRPILAALADNKILLIAGDGLRSTEFKMLEILGNPYPVPSGPVKIALMTGAVVLPVFSIPERTTIRTTIHPPLPIDSHASIETNNGYYVNTLNEQLKQTPHLWLRWRRPDWFEEAREWVDRSKSDPFGAKRVGNQ
jgi:KDO2-lipid IV(A) lauroyltransferase